MNNFNLNKLETPIDAVKLASFGIFLIFSTILFYALSTSQTSKISNILICTAGAFIIFIVSCFLDKFPNKNNGEKNEF